VLVVPFPSPASACHATCQHCNGCLHSADPTGPLVCVSVTQHVSSLLLRGSYIFQQKMSVTSHVDCRCARIMSYLNVENPQMQGDGTCCLQQKQHSSLLSSLFQHKCKRAVLSRNISTASRNESEARECLQLQDATSVACLCLRTSSLSRTPGMAAVSYRRALPEHAAGVAAAAGLE
jgi:hypothetical protein